MPEVTILPDGVQVVAQEAETLLRALARAGLRYRVGCKRGGCGICKVQLKLGEVRYERPIADSVLSDDERVEGHLPELPCRTDHQHRHRAPGGRSAEAGTGVRLPDLDELERFDEIHHATGPGSGEPAATKAVMTKEGKGRV